MTVVRKNIRKFELLEADATHDFDPDVLAELMAAMKDRFLDVDFIVSVSGGFYPQTNESPAEVPEMSIRYAEVGSRVVVGEVAKALIEACGGEDEICAEALRQVRYEERWG